MADSGKKLRDNEKEMLEYNKSLSAELSKILETKGKIGKLTEDESLDYAIIMDKLKGSKNLGEQITKLTQERNTYISEQVQLGNDISDQLIEQFDTELKLLEKKKELKDLEEQRKEIGKDLAKDLGSAVGVSGELVDAIMKMSVAAVGLKSNHY